MANSARLGRRRFAAACLTVLAAATVACSSGGGPATRLATAGEIATLETTEAYVGTTYNTGAARLQVTGTDVVEIVSIEVTSRSPGAEVVPASLVRLAPGVVQVGGSAGDPEKQYPGTKLVDPAGVRIAPADGDKWYVLVRARPTQLGSHEIGDVRVRYRVGGDTETLTLATAWTIVASHTGRDPRVDLPPDAGPTVSPTA